MNLFKESIIELPEGLKDTDIYKLLKLFDDLIVQKYQLRFRKEDEFPAIRAAVEFFYKSIERLDGKLDEKGRDIDINYLVMQIQSCKSTREFSKILLNGNFNLDAGKIPMEDFIKILPSLDIEVRLKTIIGDTAEDSIGKLENMLNHLLYFHNILWFLDEFTQVIQITSANDKYSYLFKNLNSQYYEYSERI